MSPALVTISHVCPGRGVCPRGLSDRGDVYHTPLPIACWDTPAPVNRMTDRCKNITLHQTSSLTNYCHKVRECFPRSDGHPKSMNNLTLDEPATSHQPVRSECSSCGVYLFWNFSSWLRDSFDIYRFLVVHMVKTHFLLENKWISGESLRILEKFQCNLALPNIKYNCVILFLCQMCWSFVYASKYIFS